jgi:hypothetical protein
MSDAHASAAPMADEPHGLEDHGEGHGHDDHAHPDEALGPIDWPAYGAGVLGVVIGLAVTWAFVLSKAVAST